MMSDGEALAKLVNTMAWGHASPEVLACAPIRKVQVYISRGGDLVDRDRFHAEDVVRAAKPSFLQVCTARAGVLISTSDVT